ncbi:MAG: DUF4197 domain-containing protein [Balneolales bacterium]
MRLSLVLSLMLSFLWTAGCEPVRELIETGSGGAKLTEDEVIAGLRQALEVGAESAGDQASEEGGFYDNPRLFIPFPEDMDRVEETLRGLGLNTLVDNFIEQLNRSAEQAAADAAPIFLNAIGRITIQDGLDILQGPDHAATRYLQRQTSTELAAAFRPVIEQAMEATLATRYWENIATRYNQIPLAANVETDLTGYTTNRAIDGLFVLIEEAEREIRNNPAARGTDLLRRVFGGQDE